MRICLCCCKAIVLLLLLLLLLLFDAASSTSPSSSTGGVPLAVGFTANATYGFSAHSLAEQESSHSESTAASESSPVGAAVIDSCGSSFSNFGHFGGFGALQTVEVAARFFFGALFPADLANVCCTVP